MSLGLPLNLPLPPEEEAPNSATPQELGANPGLARLLRDLGGLLGGDGLSPPLQKELRQAEVSLCRARALWLRLELLWRILGELIRDPRDLEPSLLRAVEQELTWAQVRRGPPEMAGLLPPPQPPRLLPRLLPELQRRLREKREELRNFLLGPPKTPKIPPKNPKITQNPPKITQNHPEITQNPPKITQNPPKITQNPPKITQNRPEITQIPPKINQNPPEIQQNPPKIAQNAPKITQNPPKITQNPPKITQNPPEINQNPPKITQNPPKIQQIPPKITQNPPEITQIPPKIPEIPGISPGIPENPEILGIFPEIPGILPNLGRLLERERLRQRRLREKLERTGWEYPQVLGRSLAHLSHLSSLGSLQAHLDRGRGLYLLAKGGAVLLKSRLEELRILLDSYPAPTIEAHRRIRAGLSERRRAAEAQAAILGAELAALRGLGPEFRDLALELGRIRRESDRKRWALRQLRPPPP